MPSIKKDINNEILLKALENEDNESLMQLTTKKIKEMNLNVLKELYKMQKKIYKMKLKHLMQTNQ